MVIWITLVAALPCVLAHYEFGVRGLCGEKCKSNLNAKFANYACESRLSQFSLRSQGLSLEQYNGVNECNDSITMSAPRPK